MKFQDQSVPTLLGDPQYALLNAKRVSEMVSDVMVAAEFLFQAEYSEAKRELASTFVHRRMLAVELSARQGSAARAIEDRVVRLHKDFQELERIHHILEVQDLQRRIADMEKRLGDAHRTFHAGDPASEADRANAAAFGTAHTQACCLARHMHLTLLSGEM
jgi:hypothetical protein